LILPFLLAALAFLTLLAIVVPLLKGHRTDPERARYDEAVYRDQLRELDREIERGLLTADEAGTARLEIQRRLLAADRTPGLAPARVARSPAMAVVVFAVIAIGSIGTYLWIGAPGVPDMPFSSRPPQVAATDTKEQLSLEQSADDLAAKLKANPSDVQGWLLYGRTMAALNRWSAAVDAYRHAMTLGQDGPDVTADYAEMLVMEAGGTVTPAAETAFETVLKDDPKSGIARYYLAIAAGQAGEPAKTIAMLQGLLADMPSDSPLRGEIGRRIGEAARSAGVPVPELAKGTPSAATSAGPDANDVAAAANMSDDQRQAMIRSMVDRLAAKQEADPTNLDGWLQLGRAYAVLHETDKAADAFDRAAGLKPDDASIPLQAVRILLADQKPTDRLPPRIVALLKQVEANNPKEPAILWFLGIAAVQDKHPADAKRYWTDLLAVLPASSDDAHTVQAALDMLAKAGGGSGG
jgi:cytochrome c-type biogenesis protein CcmH